jgi:uncharacterized protein (DUF608 family)
MSISRRRFLADGVAASGAALAACHAFPAPYRVSVQRESGAKAGTGRPESASGMGVPGSPLVIPSTMPMGSGAPLGGIGTGFVEIRPDGCFYEWQIFNSGPWSQNARYTTAPPPPGPEYLRFVLRTQQASEPALQVRRLYLRADESDAYTLPFVQDVQSIDYSAWFPMTSLRYNDDSIPVRVSAQVFSPFIVGHARESATPGFHVVYTIENVSRRSTDVALAGFLDNPLASALPERRLTNSLLQSHDSTSIFFDTAAHSGFPSGIGNLCLSVTGPDRSYIGGTFKEYALPGSCVWKTDRVNYMVLNVLHEFSATGKLPNRACSVDPRIALLTDAEIDALSDSKVQSCIKDLSSDALLARVFADAALAGPHELERHGKELLKEVRLSLLGKKNTPPLTWGTGALASSVQLKPGQKVEIRFTLSWYFPHHLTVDGHEMGHMYANWYKDAADVNRFLCTNYPKHRTATESFARTLADTSLGDPMAFAWSSQLSTLIFNTWWTKDDGYAIWEGLGCCGLSTTDVDYQGSFPVLALFPDLKLSQMKRILVHQNAIGQVPHNYPGNVDQADDGFARVDMNPQFVMMVCRDYLWTGDREYLKAMWPHVVKAMAFTESLDTNADALPDRDTGLHTYDQWRMRGTPAYIASLWLGGLRAAICIANDMRMKDYAQHWSELLKQASASFDRMLFNGEYYSLWVDGSLRDELCMTDQVSGEWFTGLIGLPTTLSEEKLHQSIDSVLKYNFNAEFGVHNATAPKKGLGLLALTNLQAGGLWSGIEFAFASLLMDHGRYADGVRVVEAIHRRYLRAGQPWNHVECGGHYSRAMSSWATLLAATGFKPNLPNQSLAICPQVQGDFHAPWFTAAGYGVIRKAGSALTVSCVSGALNFKILRVNSPARSVRIGSLVPSAHFIAEEPYTKIEFDSPVTLTADQTMTIL